MAHSVLSSHLFLSLPVSSYMFLSLPISSYLFLSLPICSYLSLSLPICSYLSLSLPISPYLSLCLPISSYLFLSTHPDAFLCLAPLLLAAADGEDRRGRRSVALRGRRAVAAGEPPNPDPLTQTPPFPPTPTPKCFFRVVFRTIIFEIFEIPFESISLVIP